MRKHIDLAKQNAASLAGHPDMDRQWARAVQSADLVWALWTDQGPDTRLGHGLSMLKGAWYLAAHRKAGVDARCRVVRLMFLSFEEAQRIGAMYGDDAPFEESRAS